MKRQNIGYYTAYGHGSDWKYLKSLWNSTAVTQTQNPAQLSNFRPAAPSAGTNKYYYKTPPKLINVNENVDI